MCRICRRIGNVSPRLTEEESARAELVYAVQEEQEEAVWEAYHQFAPPRTSRVQLATRVPPTKLVVEPAPSHDGAPTFAAWMAPLDKLEPDTNSPDGYSDSPPLTRAESCRPVFGIRIYDTTPDATGKRAALLVRRISELTRDRIDKQDSDEDRIEVVALPLPASWTTEQRGAKCSEHNAAERKCRNALGNGAFAASWYIPEDDICDCMRIWVIDRLDNSWEQALRFPVPASDERRKHYRTKQDVKSVHGSFFEFIYDKSPHPVYEDDEEEEEEDTVAGHYDLESLEKGLKEFRGFRGNIYWFFEAHFITEGVLEKELAHARGERTELETEAPIESIEDSAWNGSQWSESD
ncbi:hypothetical protein B0T24DRAFT_305424 [Lasiosphaeria ovina]|uniref:Uncharacterized protein n=1 Tax=Lasiosphaeria ovina TaxID=92902 RepID=A0AAE0N5P6_9PEZI|nr:hypothetical protein B0T24DRAFT_305424 [Lasiosphaeria ovina]